jgi:membrane peptidoglycan carboxypeptidase
VREALASSYNIPAVVTLDHIGVNAMIRLADNAGLETLSNNADLDLSVTLGGGEVRLLDLAQAYSIFPNGGFHIDPSFILKVSTHDGDTLYEWRQHELNNRVLDERIAYIITDILSDEEARIPSFGRNSALSIGRPAAAKTGTTTDFRDNWVMGYTPNLVVGVWVGNADNTPMTDVTGISGAGPIWNQFMRRVLTGQPELEFRRPDGILETEVCALSGLLPTEACALRRRELFLPGTVPTEEDNLYQTFEIDRVTGLLADDNTPEDQKVEQTYIVLPQEARDWGIRNGVRQPPLGAIVELGDDADVRVLQPDPYSIFQISPVTPLETQRIRFTVRTPTGTESVFYTLDGTSLGALDEAPWSMWWGLELGDHELTATAISADGTRETSETVYFRVTDYEPPQSYTVEDNP